MNNVTKTSNIRRLVTFSSRNINWGKPHIYFCNGVWRCTWPRSITMRHGVAYERWVNAKKFVSILNRSITTITIRSNTHG
ncbi:MAG: hypothetical protein Tp152SUR00d2C52646391_60 [Prokaryotic dsDNA virus sp.]|nr:MAG: hypothetical protein Tp152SUR00d2C52646391_60 [Prokaryotic dsDNA virus sp.]